MPRVRILNVSHVPLSLPTNPNLHSPLLDHLKLSFFDTVWIGLPPIQRLLLYHDTNLSFPSLLKTLKSSLSHTLLHYYPLAGKLTYLPSSGDVEIDCSPDAVGEGVAFVEAESDMDLQRLAGDETHDLEYFLQLVPELDIRVLPAPVFSVQVTGFAGGGVAVGFSAHHAVADGKAIWRFVDSWATACRTGGGAAAGFEPLHDRAVIRHPRGDEIARRFLKDLAPALPNTTASILPIQGRLQLTRRTFMITESSIRSLKERVMQQVGVAQPSTFVAVSAHAWISFLLAKSMKDDEDTVLVFLVDCRTRLHPPLEEGYSGNCVKPCHAQAKVSELLGEGGFGHACSMIKCAIHECLEEPLSGCEDWVETYLKLPMSRLVNVAASPRFKVYETDFGWGKPSRVELVSMNHDGEVVLVGARDEGGVQVSVALSPLHMDGFAALFMGGLGG